MADETIPYRRAAQPTARERATLAAQGRMKLDPPAPRTIAYTRVSTDMQVENGQSLDVQQNTLAGWAQMMGRTLDQVVVEAGVSGGIPFAQRPEGGKLWAELRRGDVLVASKLDRMFRSAVDCLTVAEQLKARGVSLYLLDIGNGGDDLSAGNGQSTFFLQIMAAVAQFERSRIGERIRATKQAQKSRGEYLGGVAPFGFRHDDQRRLVPIPEQQVELRRIHELAAWGLSPYKIVADLATRGVKLSHVSVRKIIAARRGLAA
jgi:DNA invertase Pin-like site-specific DNA recombinase